MRSKTQKDHRRFGGAQEHNHVHRGNIHPLIEHVHGKDHADLLPFQLPDGQLPIPGEFPVRIAVHGNGRHAPPAKFLCHLLRMAPGAAKAQGPFGAILPVIPVNQLIPPGILDVGRSQLVLIVTPLYQTKGGVIRLIINPIIMEGDQHPFVDGLLERNFKGDIVVTNLIDISPVQPIRRSRKAQQKAGLEVVHNPPVGIVDRVMEFVHHNVVKGVRRKEFPRQVLGPSQGKHGGKHHRFVRVLMLSVKKSIILRAPHVAEGHRRLLQDFLPVGHKQNPLVVGRVKGRQICFAHAGGRLHQPPDRPLSPAILQGIQRFNLCAPGLEKRLRGLRFFPEVVPLQIFGDSRPVPALGIPGQLLPVNANGMILKQIQKGVIEHRKIGRIPAAGKTVIPLNPGCQRAFGQVGGANIDFPLRPAVEDIGLRVERTGRVVVEPQVHPVPQLLFDEIQGRGLGDAQIVSGEDPHLHVPVQRPLQIR